jgi:hypothetical protein
MRMTARRMWFPQPWRSLRRERILEIQERWIIVHWINTRLRRRKGKEGISILVRDTGYWVLDLLESCFTKSSIQSGGFIGKRAFLCCGILLHCLVPDSAGRSLMRCSSDQLLAFLWVLARIDWDRGGKVIFFPEADGHMLRNHDTRSVDRTLKKKSGATTNSIHSAIV